MTSITVLWNCQECGRETEAVISEYDRLVDMDVVCSVCATKRRLAYWRDRASGLEKKIAEQTERLACLGSALETARDMLNTLESN